MATLFVDKLDPQSGTALEIGSSGDTITIPSGATITNNGTQTGFGGSNTPYVFARSSSGADQSISASTWTKVTLGTEYVDSDNAFASNTFTVPSGEAGKYLITALIRWEALNGTSDYGYLSIANSDRSTTYQAAAQSGNTGYGFFPITVTALVNLSVSDTISLWSYATEAAVLTNENCGITICKMID